MKVITDYKLGDVLEFRKPHPCGNNLWKVIRYGVDCKLECCKCKHVILISRLEASKKIKKIHRNETL